MNRKSDQARRAVSHTSAQPGRGCVITGNEPQIGPRPGGPVAKFSPARKGWEIPQDDPSAGGAAPNLLSCATALRAEAMRTARRALGSKDPPQTMSVIDSFGSRQQISIFLRINFEPARRNSPDWNHKRACPLERWHTPPVRRARCVDVIRCLWGRLDTDQGGAEFEQRVIFFKDLRG